MTTRARLNREGLVMHYHEPYNYWQWPWEDHQRALNSHALQDVEHPIWVDLRGRRITPTDTMVDQYQRALRGPTYEFREWQRGRLVMETRRQETRIAIQNNQFAPHIIGRKFGVEIECVTNRGALLDLVSSRGITMRTEDYNHATRNYWKIVTDSSLYYGGNRTNFHTAEIVSPPLVGLEGLRQLEQVCQSLQQINSLVNRSCGLHIHHDATTMTANVAKVLANNYNNAQMAINKMVAPTRRTTRNNTYCRPFYASEIDRINNANTMSEISRIDRYRTLNLAAWEKHRTVEFRQHQGTVEFPKIAAWLEFGQHMIRASERGIMVPLTNDVSQLFRTIELPDSLYSFLMERVRQIARANNEEVTETPAPQWAEEARSDVDEEDSRPFPYRPMTSGWIRGETLTSQDIIRAYERMRTLRQ